MNKSILALALFCALPAANAADTTSSSSSGDNKTMAKNKLAPHVLMVESSLASALDQVRGLKSGLKLTQEQQQASPEYVAHFKMFRSEINSDLKMARAHESELQSMAQGNFPKVIQSDDYKSANKALNDLVSLNQGWQKQTDSSSYWQNSKQAMNDLNQLEKRISAALDESKAFASSQLDLRTDIS